ncbi:MAG: DUF4190 domain-containing protein, partial [Mycobacterium sp.]
QCDRRALQCNRRTPVLRSTGDRRAHLRLVAMRETKRTGQDGYGLALAGAIIGGLTLAGTLIVVVLYLALMFSGWQWT